MEGVIGGNPDVHKFSAKTSYYLACVSKCAYEESGDLVEKLGLGDKLRFFTCGQFRGFVATLDNAALLAFRGTHNIGNCLTDADTLLLSRSPYPGKVHCGFAEAIEEVWAEVRRLLGKPTHARPVCLAGHSLGAAMATLASVRLASEGYQVRAVYTYGSPRVGDRTFRDSYHLPNYRFVNDNDLVPHLPFRWCYKHVGKIRLLDCAGEYTEELADWKAKKRSLAGKAKRVQRAHRHSSGIMHFFSEFDWLVDHHLDKYMDAIKRLLPRVPCPRRSEQLEAASGGASARSLRLDAAQPAVPAPLGHRVSRPKLAISEVDLIAAIAKPPQGTPSGGSSSASTT
jgi:triacylglycerol lipase